MSETELFSRVVRRFCPEGVLRRSWKLIGGVSATTHALEIELPDGRLERRVLRRHGPGDLAVNPDVAADEARLLALLAEAALPVPRVFDLDRSGEVFPTPYLVIDYLDGDWRSPPEDLDARTRPPTEILARVHGFSADDPKLTFLGRRDPLSQAELARERALPADEALERQLRDVLADLQPLPASGTPCLLHGDFWPGNWLWLEGRLSAILDWEDAGLGDALVDLAQMRLEILWAWGDEAMLRATQHYAALRPFDPALLPCYDIWVALRGLLRYGDWGLPAAELKDKRDGLTAFATAALAALEVHGAGAP